MGKRAVKKAKNLYLIHQKNLFAIDIHFKMKKAIFHGASTQMQTNTSNQGTLLESTSKKINKGGLRFE